MGNVAEACRRGGIDRTSFLRLEPAFQLHGLDGLKDLPPIAKSNPMTTPVEVVARIEALALLHPTYGCNRIEAMLALGGRRVSAITIQKILNDKGLGTRHERWLALERTNANQAISLRIRSASRALAPVLRRESPQPLPFTLIYYWCSGQLTAGVPDRITVTAGKSLRGYPPKGEAGHVARVCLSAPGNQDWRTTPSGRLLIRIHPDRQLDFVMQRAVGHRSRLSFAPEQQAERAHARRQGLNQYYGR